jgi:hypothetical protein
MASRLGLFSVTALVLAALLEAPAAPAVVQPVVGGTLDLGQGSSNRSIVAAEHAAAAVALLPGTPRVAAVGQPGVRHAAGQVRIAQLKAGKVVSQSTIAGVGTGARTGAALAVVLPAFGRRNAGLLVGAPRARVPGRGRAGVAFVVANPVRTRRLRLGGSGALTILGAEDGDHLGTAVGAVPDIDGDEHPEVLVGASGADPQARPGAGAAYVIPSRGMTLGGTVDLADPEAALRIDGPIAGARAGRAVAGSSDTNGDGRGEVILGAPGWGARAGAAYVVHLAPGARVDLAAADAPALALLGTNRERAGTAVSAPRDLDDDGLPDVAIGAPRANIEGRGRAGAVYVVTPGAAEGAIALAGTGPPTAGESRGDRAGSALAAAGDATDGDEPDLVVGARTADPLGHRSAGAAYVVSGPAAARGVDLALLGSDGVRLAGGSEGAGVGTALAGDVDLDRDGRDDVLLGERAAGPADRTFLLATPALPGPAAPERRCDAKPVSMVLDTSGGLAEADPKKLRGSALQLLLNHPSSKDRVIGAVEAAERPAESFLPLVPGDLTPKGQEVLQGFVDESVQRKTAAGDLRAALDVASDLNRDMRSAIVVAGPDAVWTPGPAPVVTTDVVGVGVTRGSSQDTMLRTLATASGGRYRRVGAAELQAQVARFDARRRCEDRVKTDVTVRRHRVNAPYSVSGAGTLVRSGYEIDATAETDEYTLFTDIVVTWTSPDVPIEPYELTVDEEGGPHTARFTAEDVKDAMSGMHVGEDGISLKAVGGDTFTVLRVGFAGEDSQLPPRATAAGHKKHRYHWGGGSRARGGAAAASAGPPFVDFFQHVIR